MSNRLKYILAPLLIAIVAWTSYQMLQLPLWGYLPLFQFSATWLLLVLLAEKRFSTSSYHPLWLGLSFVSGILLALGFPTSPLTPLMFIGFVPLLIIEFMLSSSKEGTSKKALFCYSYTAFVVWNILTTFWVGNTAYVGGVVAILVNSLFMSVPILLFHQTKKVMQKDFAYLSFVAYWLAWEYLHLNWEISWPWLTLGNSFAQYPSWVQWYEYTGAFGGSLWILVANFLIFKWFVGISSIPSTDKKNPFFLKGSKGQVLKTTALLLLPILLSLVLYSTYEETGSPAEVVVIQPNFEPHYDKFTVPDREQLLRFLDLSEATLTDNTDYLVFPETSFGMIRNEQLGQESITKKLKNFVDGYPKLNLVTGLVTNRVYGEEEPHSTAIREHIDRRTGDTIYWELYNSAVQLTAGNSDIPIYYKSKQVPGAEMMPYPKLFFFLKPLADKLGGSLAGHGQQATRESFQSESGGVGPVICYESVYGEYTTGYVRHGANALFIITNDGWWDNTAGHIQHLKFASLRSIETRRDIARSANTGISCFINQRGDILQPTTYNETTAIRGTILMNDSITFYVRWGDIIGRIGVFVTLLLLLNTFVKSFLPNSKS